MTAARERPSCSAKREIGREEVILWVSTAVEMDCITEGSGHQMDARRSERLHHARRAEPAADPLSRDGERAEGSTDAPSRTKIGRLEDHYGRSMLQGLPRQRARDDVKEVVSANTGGRRSW